LMIAHAGNDTGVVTVSAGVHVWVAEGADILPHTLVQAADEALYKAKSLGRNRLYPSQQSRIALAEPTA